MGLHVIVDGYNLIHALEGSAGPDLETARERLVTELSRYRKHRRHEVSAVFDGRKALGLPRNAGRRSQVGGVSVAFSRPGQEADDLIRQMARESGMRAVVVTADHALADSCRRFGAAVVSPEEFEQMMAAAEVGGGHEGLPLEEFVGEPEEEAPQPKKGPAKRPSRQERQERSRKRKL